MNRLLILALLPACALSHEPSTTTDTLAVSECFDEVVLFADSAGIWDGSKAGQVYTRLEGCEYAELLDGEVNVNALAPASEPPACPKTVTIHGELATGPVLTWAPAEEPGARVWTCSFAAPNVVLGASKP